MVKENEILFKHCNCETLIVSKIDALEKIDALVFPSSFSITQEKILWKAFLATILHKMTIEKFPVWLMWSSMELFYKKLEFEKLNKIKGFEKDINIRILDTKPFKLFLYESYCYKQEQNWFDLYQKRFKELWELENWIHCVFQKNKSLITTFSPDYGTDYRLHEYFVNEVI